MTRVSARYLAFRIVASYVTFLAVMTVMFVTLRMMPGDFVSAMTNPRTPTSVTQRLKAEWGLNQPLWKQYIHFMINYHQFNFGWSPVHNAPVSKVIARRLPRTMVLFGAAYFMTTVIGPLVGMYLGYWRGKLRDSVSYTGSLILYSIPGFWMAWLVVWLVNRRFNVLPTAYMVTQFVDQFGLFNKYGVTHWTVMADVFLHIIAPLITLLIYSWVGYMLIMRTNMNNVTDTQYVYLARAKGLSERAVLIKHAARNALIPVATGAIIGIIAIIDGSVLIENVFSWPGIGQLIVSSVLGRNYPLAQAVFFTFAGLVIALRLVVDVVYTYLDPRIKFGGEA